MVEGTNLVRFWLTDKTLLNKIRSIFGILHRNNNNIALEFTETDIEIVYDISDMKCK